MSRYNRNLFDDDEGGGFGGGGSSSNRSSGGGYRGGQSSSYSQQRGGRVEDDFGGGSRSGYSRGYGGGSDYGGSSRGGGGSVGLGPSSSSSSYQYGRGGGYSDSGYGHGGYDEPPLTDTEFQERKQAAIRRMEDSSFSSLRTLHDCVRMGTETTEELDRQAEALDRVETKLDEVHVELDKGERNLRKIKSPFGGVMNYFSKKKTVNEVTDPKGFKPSQPSGNKKSSGGKGGGKQQSQAQALQQQQTYKSTGSEVVDKNLDLMGKALDDLMGIGELIGEQLDDSDHQIDRITYKMDRDHVKLEKLNKGIKKELYK